jgi:hypothetical protein
MSKKGELGGGTAFMIFIILLVVIDISNSISRDSYRSFKQDCENIYQKDYLLNTTCDSQTLPQLLNGTKEEVSCQKTDWENLDKFCLDKYTKDGNTSNAK